MELSQLFYIYRYIHEYCTEPFTTVDAEVLIQASAVILNNMSLNQTPPKGILMSNIVFCLAKQARQLGAFQTARFAYKKIQTLKVPDRYEEEIDIESMTIQAEPENDEKTMEPICCRCGNSNPIIKYSINTFGTENVGVNDACAHCLHPNIRCFLNFDILPLVEFLPISSYDTALLLICETHNADSLRKDTNADDLFNAAITSALEEYDQKYVPVKADNELLRHMNREDVFVLREASETSGTQNSIRFFKNMIPEIGISLCQNCHHFFHEEDFEYHCLKQGSCPFCREPCDSDYGHI